MERSQREEIAALRKQVALSIIFEAALRRERDDLKDQLQSAQVDRLGADEYTRDVERERDVLAALVDEITDWDRRTTTSTHDSGKWFVDYIKRARTLREKGK